MEWASIGRCDPSRSVNVCHQIANLHKHSKLGKKDPCMVYMGSEEYNPSLDLKSEQELSVNPEAKLPWNLVNSGWFGQSTSLFLPQRPICIPLLLTLREAKVFSEWGEVAMVAHGFAGIGARVPDGLAEAADRGGTGVAPNHGARWSWLVSATRSSCTNKNILRAPWWHGFFASFVKTHQYVYYSLRPTKDILDFS